MVIEIRTELSVLWQIIFEKNKWNPVNFIVCANGTGKSLFADQLTQKLANKGLKPMLLIAEMLAGNIQIFLDNLLFSSDFFKYFKDSRTCP